MFSLPWLGRFKSRLDVVYDTDVEVGSGIIRTQYKTTFFKFYIDLLLLLKRK